MALERCLALEPQTRSLHWGGAGYTPGRQALHRAILQRSTAGRRCVSSQAPIALLTGGPPGAGKTTWLQSHAPMALSPATLRIDADEIRAQLPEYRGWNAMSTQQETGDIVDQLLESIGSPCRTDLVYDGTLTHARRYLALIPQLHALGYRVFLIYVTVPEAVSQERALERYRATGRYVPMGVIRESYAQGPMVFRILAPRVDGFVEVDGLSGAVRASGGTPLPSLRP
jgi:predicted ABC-type ATPase